MAAALFISYSSHDQKAASRLVEFLEQHGHSCWIACRDELPGEKFWLPLMAALKAAPIMLLVLTQAACESPDVGNEIVQAVKQRKLILPVQLEPVHPNDLTEYHLRGIQWHDATAGLTEWTLEALLSVIDRNLAVREPSRDTSDLLDLTNRALAGDTAAQFLLAEHFESTGRESSNQIAAVTWFRKAAEAGHPEAAYRLAVHLHEGTGVLRNEDAALTWFRTAAQLGHVQAQLNFANELLLGRRISPNLQQALHWFEKAAEAGSVEAQFQAAVLLENGRAGTRDDRRAIHWLERAAASSHAGAQFLLARLLLDGKAQAPDIDRARYWAQLASDHGHLGARQLLSRMPPAKTAL
jgi:TPR repeat protein